MDAHQAARDAWQTVLGNITLSFIEIQCRSERPTPERTLIAICALMDAKLVKKYGATQGAANASCGSQ